MNRRDPLHGYHNAPRQLYHGPSGSAIALRSVTGILHQEFPNGAELSVVVLLHRLWRRFRRPRRWRHPRRRRRRGIAVGVSFLSPRSLRWVAQCATLPRALTHPEISRSRVASLPPGIDRFPPLFRGERATILEPEGVFQRPVVPQHVRGAAESDDIAMSQRARPVRYEVPVQIRPIQRVLVRDGMQSVRVAHDLRVLTRKQAGHARAVQLHLVEPMSSHSDHPGVPGRLQGDEVRKTRSRGRIADSDERRIDGTRCRQRSAAAIAARNRD
mmetsp:Transcript_12233/g.52682  ORF Transcript_12233/g.52682 Transcript_12233/m.52682 type:complete len:271 (+) Transcript_12233:3588-4400(+)